MSRKNKNSVALSQQTTVEENEEWVNKLIEASKTHRLDLRSLCTKQSEISHPIEVTEHCGDVHVHARIVMKKETYEKMRHLAALSEKRIDEFISSTVEEMTQAYLSNEMELGQLIAKRIKEEVYDLTAAAPHVKIEKLREIEGRV